MKYYITDCSNKAISKILNQPPRITIDLDKSVLANARMSENESITPFTMVIMGKEYRFVAERLSNGKIWLIDDEQEIDFYLTPL